MEMEQLFPRFNACTSANLQGKAGDERDIRYLDPTHRGDCINRKRLTVYNMRHGSRTAVLQSYDQSRKYDGKYTPPDGPISGTGLRVKPSSGSVHKNQRVAYFDIVAKCSFKDKDAVAVFLAEQYQCKVEEFGFLARSEKALGCFVYEKSRSLGHLVNSPSLVRKDAQSVQHRMETGVPKPEANVKLVLPNKGKWRAFLVATKEIHVSEDIFFRYGKVKGSPAGPPPRKSNQLNARKRMKKAKMGARLSYARAKKKAMSM